MTGDSASLSLFHSASLRDAADLLQHPAPKPSMRSSIWVHPSNAAPVLNVQSHDGGTPLPSVVTPAPPNVNNSPCLLYPSSLELMITLVLSNQQSKIKMDFKSSSPIIINYHNSPI